MIEVVSFGGGFRLDGPDWGQRARPYLENNWRELQPGVHMLDPGGEFAIINKMIVHPDGQGHLAFEVDPQVQAAVIAESGAARILRLNFMGQRGMPIDENTRFRQIMNIPRQDLFAEHRPLFLVPPSALLVGLVRYNPS